MNSSKKQKRLIIFSGGTVNYIRPHLAICAPAYGKVGRQITARMQSFRLDDLIIVNERTKMAGGDKIATNAELDQAVKHWLGDPSVCGIVMAAAVCDFDVNSITSWDVTTDKIGRHHDRLSSDSNLSVQLTPAEKIIDQIKQKRPDILLVTFKTAHGVQQGELKRSMCDNMERSNSDIVFGNDIASYTNYIVDDANFNAYDNREIAVLDLCHKIAERITRPI